MKKNNIMLTESQLRRIVRESMEDVLCEARGLSSQKLYGLLQQHGGIPRGVSGNFSNLSDGDVIGVYSREDIQGMQRSYRDGLAGYAVKLGYNLDGSHDEVSTAELSDGSFLVYINRNGHGSFSNMDRNPDAKNRDWRSYACKRDERSMNRGRDGQRSFVPMSDRGQAARQLRNDWDFRGRKNGWENPQRVQKGMLNVRQGLDAYNK